MNAGSAGGAVRVLRYAVVIAGACAVGFSAAGTFAPGFAYAGALTYLALLGLVALAGLRAALIGGERTSWVFVGMAATAVLLLAARSSRAADRGRLDDLDPSTISAADAIFTLAATLLAITLVFAVLRQQRAERLVRVDSGVLFVSLLLVATINIAGLPLRDASGGLWTTLFSSVVVLSGSLAVTAALRLWWATGVRSASTRLLAGGWAVYAANALVTMALLARFGYQQSTAAVLLAVNSAALVCVGWALSDPPSLDADPVALQRRMLDSSRQALVPAVATAAVLVSVLSAVSRDDAILMALDLVGATAIIGLTGYRSLVLNRAMGDLLAREAVMREVVERTARSTSVAQVDTEERHSLAALRHLGHPSDPSQRHAADHVQRVAQSRREYLATQRERDDALAGARLAEVATATHDVIVFLDDKGDVVRMVGDIEHLTGAAASVWVGRSVRLLFSDAPADAAGLTQRENLLDELRVLCRSGLVVEVVEVQLGDERVLALRDVTVRSQLLADVAYRASHDDLTGLANRAQVAQWLTEVERDRHTDGTPYSVVFLDVNDFKFVNDSLGHTFGDAVLVSVADRLVANLSPADRLARVGGDEFVVVLPRTTLEGATDLATQLVSTDVEPLDVHGVEITVRLSAGVAQAGGDAGFGEEVVRSADMAMYEARRGGSPRMAVFHKEMRTAVDTRLADADWVTATIREHGLTYAYQPIFATRGGDVVAVEALLRPLETPHGLAPARIVEVAESLGELVRIFEQLLPQACSQIGHWRRRQPHLRMSLNVNAAALEDASTIGWILEAMSSQGADPSWFIVEITEQAAVGPAAETAIGVLRAAGVSVWIDDFGTGWSSLGYLDRLQVDGVKLAREIVTALDGSLKIDLVQAAASLAHRNGLLVVAEGVENRTDLDALIAAGVDLVQGFEFGRPAYSQATDYWEKVLLNEVPVHK